MSGPGRRLRAALVAAAAALLAGCENDAASYQIGGSMDNALTLIREQRWLWDAESAVHLVVARYPDCQRRHVLNRMPVGEVRAAVFQTGPQAYLLANGDTWYAIDQRSCDALPAAPPAEGARGIPLGNFERQDGKLRFVAAAPPAQPAVR